MAGVVALTRRALLATTALALPAGALAAPAAMTYRDPKAPIEARVRDLLSRMTLEEKVQQLRCMWLGKSAILDKDGVFSAEKAAKALHDGIGQIARPNDTAGTSWFMKTGFRHIDDGVAFINAVQKHLVENTRLGIPALFHEETAHGYMARGATIFPIPPGLASTWDPPLVEQAFTVVGREARARGADEVVITNLAGEITEAAVSNIGFVRDGALVLPPLEAGILAGITRDLLIGQVAPAAGVKVREQAVRPEDLGGMRECFLTSTTKDLVPVRAIDATTFQTGAETVTMRLKRAFAAHASAYAKAHPGQAV